MKIECSKKYYEQEFIPYFLNNGYDRNQIKESLDKGHWLAVVTNNGVRVELKFMFKKICILVDYQTTKIKGKPKPKEQLEKQVERHNIMKDHFVGQGRKILTRKELGSNKDDHGKCFLLEFKNIQDLLLIIRDVENLDGIAKTRKYGTQLFPNEYNPLLIAKGYVWAVENGNQPMLNLHREMLTADDFKSVIALNTKGSILCYGEHLVPCIKIHNEAIAMAKAGESAIKISQMIEKNLKIVYIRTKDADRLNGPLGLKIDMPKGWKFGDDIFARLNVGKIKWEIE